jgi:hypothetical protein
MRYYNVVVTNAQTGAAIKGADGTAFGPWSSLTSQGANNPGALRVKWDLPIAPFDQPIGGAYLRLWGVPLTMIGQASQFNPSPDYSQYCRIQIYGGMSKGLPLANPAQQGLLVDGAIQQAFGNWQGTEQTIDFVILPNAATAGNYGTPQVPKNLAFNWTQGQKLGDAVQKTLASAFPKATITGSAKVNQTLTLPYAPQHGYYESVGQFAEYIAHISQDIVNGSDGPSNYLGIKIVPNQNGFALFDGTNQATPKQIVFTDLIGQPTWLSPLTLNFKCVMRADLAVGDYIKMPVAQTTQTSQSFSQYRNKATFQGTFQISAVRHLGDSRQPSGDSWVTVIDCWSNQEATATAPAS